MSLNSDVAAGIMFSGPSGVGKSTLIKHLLNRYGEWCRSIVSHTTRGPRDGERDGIDYHFVDVAEFRRLIDAGEMHQYVEFDGQMYGTSKSSVDYVINDGKICIFDVLAATALDLRKKIEGRFVLVFIKPPSIEELRRRLQDRGDVHNIDCRIGKAEMEMEKAKDFDHIIENKVLEEAKSKIDAVVSAEVRKISGKNLA